jgi:formylmethanofuran dehydrogenase subunit A
MNLRGKILWASGKVKEEDSKLLLKRKEDFFQKYNSLFLKSYSMPTKGLNLKEID